MWLVAAFSGSQIARFERHINTSEYESIHPSTCRGSNSPEPKIIDMGLCRGPARNQHKESHSQFLAFGNDGFLVHQFLLDGQYSFKHNQTTNGGCAIQDRLAKVLFSIQCLFEQVSSDGSHFPLPLHPLEPNRSWTET